MAASLGMVVPRGEVLKDLEKEQNEIRVINLSRKANSNKVLG